MRLTFNNDEIESLMSILEKGNKTLYANLALQIEQNNNRDISKKQNSTMRANKLKVDRSKKLIVDAINILRLEGQKINASTVSKKSGLSYITCTKYLKIFNSNMQKDTNEEDSKCN